MDVDVSRCKKIDFEDFVEVFLDLEEAVPGTCSPLGDHLTESLTIQNGIKVTQC